jgi:hypothetical protein
MGIVRRLLNSLDLDIDLESAKGGLIASLTVLCTAVLCLIPYPLYTHTFDTVSPYLVKFYWYNILQFAIYNQKLE